MQSKPSIEYWREIKGSSSIWELSDGNKKIISVLKLSFNNLQSSALKQCFAYCSTFPKDFEIERDDLIQLWMAQGLLQPSEKKNNLEMEDIGNEYFDILLKSSLFQDATVDDYGIITTCKMHDLVHDLSQLVSKSESWMRDVDKIADTLEIQHVSQVSTSTLERIPEKSVRRLRSLSLNDRVPASMFPWFKALRALKLYGANIEEFPISMGKMKHLRYLDISETRSLKTLPKSIGKLYNLQTLRAMECGLEEFPKEVQNLINLRHFYFGKRTKFPLGMGRLTQLRTLPYFFVGKEMGCRIEELAALNELNGELVIYNLELVSDANEAKKAKLEEKRNLRHLKFVWSTTTNNEGEPTKNEENVLEGLQPHPKLESLKIKNFMGAKFPSWMMLRPLLLNHLKKIHLRECKKCDRVPPLGLLPELMELSIYGMDSLKCIGAEFYGCSSVNDAATTSKHINMGLFPKLRTLQIRRCRELIEWMDAPVESTDTVSVFPSLEEMYILDCPKLRQTPSNFPSLKKLGIRSISNARPIESISRRQSTLTDLEIEHIEELTCLPEGMLKKHKNLTALEITNCGELICISPDVFGCCPSLGSMVISDCKKLRHLPDGLDALPMLEKLTIRECPSLELIPITHGIASLRVLQIDSCEGLSYLPSGLQECTSLQELDIRNCRNLTSIPITQGMSLTSLQLLNIMDCENLSSLPALECCPSLRRLFIDGCPRLRSISISSSPEVFTNHPLQTTTGLEPEVFTSSLETFVIRSCDSLQYIPPLHEVFPSLRQLSIAKCEKLESVVSEQQIPVSVEELEISDFPNLETLPSLRSLTGLKVLRIGKYWEELDSFPDLQVPSSQLESLFLYGWPKLKSLPHQTQHFTSLTYLRIDSFDGVEALPEWLGNLTSLMFLSIYCCRNLKCLPSAKAMQSLTKLQVLQLDGCPLLQSRCARGSGPEWAKISHIPCIRMGQDVFVAYHTQKRRPCY